MARRATAIEKERQASKGIVLTLDAGNTLTGRWLSDKTQGAIMIEAMNAMAYDAMVIGQGEMALGLDELKKRESEAEFAFLSANIVSAADSRPIFRSHIILERSGKMIAVIGISDPQSAQISSVSGQIAVLDAVETAQQLVNSLRPQVDLVVVLSRLGIDADKALAEAVPGIDVIVGGNTRKLMPQPERAGNALIIQQGYLGEWLGALDVTYAEGKPVQSQVRVITLGPDYADDPNMAALVQKYAQLHPTPTATPPFIMEAATSTPNR